MSEQENPQVDEEIVDAADEAVAEETAEAETPTEQGDDLAKKVEELEAQLVEAKEQALRATAEAQNTRRRAEQDVEKAHKFALEKFSGDMLVVADNLERALGSIDADDEAFKAVSEGIDLTYRSLVDALKRHKVEQVDPAGEPFDPQSHQAMSMVENGEVEPNTVINVFQKGYTLNGRLVRPAMVVVAKAP
ncbi:MAG: nucleotide exchange factor GrpE [Cellvibrionaceae bacterium]